MKSKQNIKLLFILFLCIGFSHNSQAQFWKKLKNRVKNRVEETVTRKIENKAEEKTEKTIDSLFNKKEKKEKIAKENKKNKKIDFGGMMDGIMNSGDVKTESQYIFPITATMLVENYNKKTTSNTLEQSYGKDAILNILDTSPGPIINDFKNDAAIILNIKENTAQVMSMTWMKKMMGDADEIDDSEIPKVTKTGKTKTMNGYTCYEYIIEHDTTKMDAWFAPDVDFNYQDYLRGFAKMFKGKKTNNPSTLLNKEYGYVMEMTAYQKEKKIIYMKVTNLSKEEKVIDLANYTIEKMF